MESLGPHKVTDLAALKALAHPRRQRIIDHLGRNGPATSARLARDLDLNTGATSYHLRELARHGFVVEAPEHAHGRERWWRAAHQDIRFPLRSEQDEGMRAAMDAIEDIAYEYDIEQFRRAQREARGPGFWMDAFPYSRGQIRVNPEELLAFFEDYIALMQAYDRPVEEASEDARVVLTRFLAFPAPSDNPVGEQEGQPVKGRTGNEPGPESGAAAATQEHTER
ncbi:ArsR/SmtB family transcription factor [Nocardiopsis oceani]